QLRALGTGRRRLDGGGRLGARRARGREIVGLERERSHLLTQRLEASDRAGQTVALGLELVPGDRSSLEPPFEAPALLRRPAPARDLGRPPIRLAAAQRWVALRERLDPHPLGVGPPAAHPLPRA